MSVLDTFYLMFKTDARDATEDVKKLDKEIASLAAKGNKRNEEENKQLKELRKLRTSATQDIADQTKGVDSLADSLIGVGVAAIAAFAGFEAVKKVTGDTIDLNLNLQKTRALTGQNAEEVQAWDQTFQRLGAPGGQFTQWFTAYSQYLQKTGQDTKQILPYLRSLSDELHNLPEDQARQRFQQAVQSNGLPQEFFLALREGGTALKALLEDQERLITSTKESEDAARKFAASWENVGSAVIGVANNALKPVVSVLTKIEDAITWILTLGGGGAAIASSATGIFSGSSESSAPIPTSSPSGKLPLGIRSNNPGNLQPGGREAVFPTLSAGISAEKAQLSRYGARGINTLAGIAGMWPDPKDRASYLAGLVKSTGFNPDQPLNLNDQDTLNKVSNAINKQENGAAFGNLVGSAQASAAAADQIGLNSPSGGGGTSNSISIGSVHVNAPNAKDADGIASAIAHSLDSHFRATISNWDDGVVK